MFRADACASATSRVKSRRLSFTTSWPWPNAFSKACTFFAPMTPPKQSRMRVLPDVARQVNRQFSSLAHVLKYITERRTPRAIVASHLTHECAGGMLGCGVWVLGVGLRPCMCVISISAVASLVFVRSLRFLAELLCIVREFFFVHSHMDV